MLIDRIKKKTKKFVAKAIPTKGPKGFKKKWGSGRVKKKMGQTARRKRQKFLGYKGRTRPGGAWLGQ